MGRVSDLTLAVRSDSFEEVAVQLHERLGLVFVPRFSSYRGGDYLASESGEEEVLVTRNQDGDEVAEEGYEAFGVLLQIGSSENPALWKGMLAELDAVLIREVVYEV